MIRAFIAANLPVGIVRRITEYQARLREQAGQVEGLKMGWVPPPRMHLTLKFLGDISGESAAAIEEQLLPCLAERIPVPLIVQGLGAFPDSGHPRVIWVGLQDTAEALSRLAQVVDTQLSKLGFPEEEKPFHPHVTLARVKKGKAHDLLADAQEAEFGRFSIREVVLYQSVLQPQGPKYVPLAHFPLKKG